MFGLGWRTVSRLRTGDWRAKLIAISQAIVALVAALGLLSMLTRRPVLLLSFTFAEALIPVGVVLFVIVAVTAQRTMIVEKFDAGAVIFSEGDQGRQVYVVKSGTVEVLGKRAGGPPEVIARLGPGEHFGEMALLGKAPRNATVKTVTDVEVFTMSPNNFVALYTAMPALKEHFNKLMESRLETLKPPQ